MVPQSRDFQNGDGGLAYFRRSRVMAAGTSSYHVPSYSTDAGSGRNRTVYQYHRDIASHFDARDHLPGDDNDGDKAQYYMDMAHLVFRYHSARQGKTEAPRDGDDREARPPTEENHARLGQSTRSLATFLDSGRGGTAPGDGGRDDGPGSDRPASYARGGEGGKPSSRRDDGAGGSGQNGPRNNSTGRRRREVEGDEEEPARGARKRRGDVVEEYKSAVDPLHVGPVTRPGQPASADRCPECKSSDGMLIQPTDSTIQCRHCGFCRYDPVLLAAPSYRINRTARPTMTLYKRINHFNDWISQFQAKESITVPSEVYAAIVAEIYKSRAHQRQRGRRAISSRDLRRVLRKLGFNKYYEHLPRIMHRLQGTQPPTISQETEEQMRFMFRQIQEPFMRHSPQTRKNFLSYSFVLRKFVGLLGLQDLEDSFPLLKSRSKLYQQDVIWRKICQDLGWRYEPSI